MFRIYTDAVRDYHKVLEKAFRTGDPREESLYIDLADRYIYFNLSGKYQGRLKIEADKLDTDSEDPDSVGFWVNLPTFVALCLEYPTIDYSPQHRTFSYAGDEFSLSTVVEPYDGSVFDEPKNSPTPFEVYDITADLSRVVKAFHFMGIVTASVTEKNYAGVVFIGDSVASGNGVDLYESKLSVTVPEQFPIKLGSAIQTAFVDALTEGRSLVMSRAPEDEGLRIYVYINDGEMVIAYPEEASLHYAAVTNPEFRKKFEHETYIDVLRAELNNILRFFAQFRKGDSVDPYLSLEIKNSPTESVLSIVSRSEKNIGTRQVALQEVSQELAGAVVGVQQQNVHRAVSSLSGERLRIQMTGNNADPAINLLNPNDPSEHIATIKSYDE